VDANSHGKILKELVELVDVGKIKSYLEKGLRLDLNELRKGTKLLKTDVLWGRWVLVLMLRLKVGTLHYVI
jgi:hypothetical protein